MAYTVLFICTGNMGRSPLAEVMARHRLAQALGVADGDLHLHGIRVLSAGTRALPLLQASGRAAAVAEEIGITMGRHPATRLTKKLAAAADVIFCMDAPQTQYVAKLGFGDKTRLLDPDGETIPDPRRHDTAFFRQVRSQIASALEQRVPEILADAGKS